MCSSDLSSGLLGRTVVGVTPTTQALATDYDTFTDPGPVVWVTGTTGEARMRSWRVEQALQLGRYGNLNVSGGYRMRVDHASFLDGDKTDTRNGVLVSRTVVTTPEFTTGQTHELFLRAERTWVTPAGWDIRGAGEISPAVVNRIGIELPAKYPGEVQRFQVSNLATGAVLSVSRSRTR